MFGVVLGVLATVVLLVWVNPLSALLALVAEAFYLVVYTMILKRRTTQNIVWGGFQRRRPNTSAGHAGGRGRTAELVQLGRD